MFKRISRADIVSSMNGLSGFIAVIFFVNDALIIGSFFVVLSILLDGVDGILARRYGSRHEKGPQIDSIADTISFCVAPATALYSAFYINNDPYSAISLLTIAGSSLLVFMGIVRLGTFCDEGYALDYFSGLPTPSAALVIVSSVLLFREGSLLPFPYAGIAMSFIISILMVMKIRYPKLRGKPAYLSGIVLFYLMTSFFLQYCGFDGPIITYSPVIGLMVSLGYIIGGAFYVWKNPA